MLDQGAHFVNNVISTSLVNYIIKHPVSTPYYSQGVGQAKSTNKMLVTMITKVVNFSKNNWDDCLVSVLWAYRTTYELTTKYIPFKLVFGTQLMLPFKMLVPTFPRMSPKDYKLESVLAMCINDLHQLKEWENKKIK